MKIWVILCLAAGPLAVRGQTASETFSATQPTVRRNHGVQLSEGQFFGWKPPVVHPLFPEKLQWWGGRPLPMTRQVRDSLRILLPDRMPCLVSRGLGAMPVDRRKGSDPMPNVARPAKIMTP
jgi:hypothetical protein